MKKFLPKTINNPKGFTLIELLVVISIIAILSVIGITVFSGVQKSARDATRKGDIDAIVKAWEITYVYGIPTPYQGLADSMFASGKIPTDPKGGARYAGVSTSAVASFIICAGLENQTGNATSLFGVGLGTVTNGLFYCRQSSR